MSKIAKDIKDFIYSKKDDQIIINCINDKTVTEVIIPEGVTRIGDKTFSHCSSLKSIVIPDSVTSIGDYAFNGCSSLQYNEYNNGYYLGNENNPYLVLVKAKSTDITSCEINENCKIIYSYAFSRCEKITNIVIPDSVTSIGDHAFNKCLSLTSIVIPDSVTSIDDEFFGFYFLQYNEYNNGYYLGNENNPYLVLIKVKSTDITSCEINENCKIIYSYAFFGCSSLTSIIIPNSVTSIGKFAFDSCSSLPNIVIPNSVTSIGEYTFYNCTNLTSIVIPDSVTSIGSAAFYDCLNLASIVIPDSITSIGDYAFNGCSSLQYNEYNNGYYLGNENNPYLVLIKVKSTDITSCEINENCKIIYTSSFEGCVNLMNIFIPDSVTSIGKFAFITCKNLTSIAIPNGVTEIGEYTFYNCTNLTSIVIPNGVTKIGEYTFYNCTNLISIVIPDSVTSIGEYAFRKCFEIKHTYYKGTEVKWNNINIFSETMYQLSTIYYYSEKEPTDFDNEYWHYVDDKPIEW